MEVNPADAVLISVKRDDRDSEYFSGLSWGWGVFFFGDNNEMRKAAFQREGTAACCFVWRKI